MLRLKRSIPSFTSFLCLLSILCSSSLLADSQSLTALDFSYVNDAPRQNSAREKLISSWWATGCDNFRQMDIPGRRSDNLICRIEGKSEHTIVIGAHYDKVQAGFGVADNWSGIVLLNAMVEHFQNSPTANHSLELVAFTGEELGLYGSKAYLKQGDYPVVAMVNLDTLGLRSIIIAAESDPKLSLLAKESADELEIESVIKAWPDITGDFEAFMDKDVPAVGLHSVDRSTIKQIHRRRDRSGVVNLDLLADAFRLSVSLVEKLVKDGLEAATQTSQ